MTRISHEIQKVLRTFRKTKNDDAYHICDITEEFKYFFFGNFFLLLLFLHIIVLPLNHFFSSLHFLCFCFSWFHPQHSHIYKSKYKSFINVHSTNTNKDSRQQRQNNNAVSRKYTESFLCISTAHTHNIHNNISSKVCTLNLSLLCQERWNYTQIQRHKMCWKNGCQ